jgi:hypothetical membrane protein
VRNTYQANFTEIRVAMVATQLIGVRMATLLAAMPLFALVYVMAFIDGLVRRAARCASGGRESASVYHRAKYLQLVLVVTATALFLLLLQPPDIQAVCVAGLAVVAILVSLQWTYYKKHL